MLWIYTGDEFINVQSIVRRGSAILIRGSAGQAEKLYLDGEEADEELERIYNELQKGIAAGAHAVTIKL